ncbi:GntR family transcriptional regulator [Weissella paramesenteroides]|uniref:GntR family transcriptional regulator n=1 Tax=Weissella paramesenteroides TaxID=1249 RepID=UPI0024027465|nr:GntR family transcriptional regulator [Weissella paramesenteroides]MDF8366952.1 GntR family transcriptional regulator [Weissella paramesenteroides]
MGSPVYIQIHDEIREAIDAGRWVPGDRIPAERELAEQFGVSRMTLRQAIMLLVDEGVLERRVGSGTFVSEQKVQEHLNGITSFTDLMSDAGKKATSKTISFHAGRATNSEQEQLQLAPDARVLRMERVRYGDDEPIAFEVAAIPESLIEGLSRSALTDSLYRTLAEERGLKIGRAQQTVTAAAVKERVSEYLAIKRGDPVLVLRQITYDAKGVPFEYVQTQYVGSRFEFYMEKS